MWLRIWTKRSECGGRTLFCLKTENADSGYYYFRNRITFSETMLCAETAQMQLCHLSAVCTQTTQNAFGSFG